MSYIDIENMDFYAFHGCFAEERQIGTRFRVNLRIELDTKTAQQSDCIEDTVDYLSVYQTVKKQMSIPSKLLEHVAERIVVALMEEYRQITHIWVKVTKCHPPLGGQMEGVSLTIERSRT